MKKVLILNPGHGGADPGAIGLHGLHEHAVAARIADGMESYQALQVVRVNQDGRKLRGVVADANRHDPTLFVSIHMNSSARSRLAHGVQAYYRTGCPQSERLARCLFHGIAETLDNLSRWSKVVPEPASRFYVLKNSVAKAAVLMEIDFISNPSIEREMATDSWIEKAVCGLKVGLNLYLGVKSS